MPISTPMKDKSCKDETTPRLNRPIRVRRPKKATPTKDNPISNYTESAYAEAIRTLRTADDDFDAELDSSPDKQQVSEHQSSDTPKKAKRKRRVKTTQKPVVVHAEFPNPETIEQWYTDPYERLNPGVDLMYDLQRQAALEANLIVQGWAYAKAKSLAAWFIRCNGQFEPYRPAKSREQAIDVVKRRKLDHVKSNTDREHSVSTICGIEDDVSNKDTDFLFDYELEQIEELQAHSDDETMVDVDTIDAEIERCKRGLKLFDMVYGPGKPIPHDSFTDCFSSTNIQTVPHTIPISGLKTQDHGPTYQASVLASRINLADNRDKNGCSVDVAAEDLHFGDSIVRPDELLPIEERHTGLPVKSPDHHVQRTGRRSVTDVTQSNGICGTGMSISQIDVVDHFNYKDCPFPSYNRRRRKLFDGSHDTSMTSPSPVRRSRSGGLRTPRRSRPGIAKSSPSKQAKQGRSAH